MEIILATKNLNKLFEIKDLLIDLPIKIYSLKDFPDLPDVIEDKDTFYENSLKKAQEIYNFTGITALADDSGLEVQYLDGKPGVYSARFSGENSNSEKNNQKLLKLMKGVPLLKRNARFVTVCVLFGENISYQSKGTCEGLILDKLTGNKGFGYDPLFYYEPLKKTFAEMGSNEKNGISHRGKALNIMKKTISNLSCG